MCGRVASDAFAVVLTAGPDVDIEAILRAALQSIGRPHWVDNVVRVSAHAGFAQAPHHATTRGELTRRANRALRAAAKKGPGSIVIFDLSIDTTSNDQKFIHRELPRAISANELEVHYQPIVSSQGGRMVGLAALDACYARRDSADHFYSGRRTDGADGHDRRFCVAANIAGRPAMARRSLCRSEPFAIAGTRPYHRRHGSLGIGGQCRCPVALSP